MAKLKRIKLYAPRPTIIPGLGLPLVPAIAICYGAMLSGVIFRGWRAWLVLAVIWSFVYLWARTRVMQDHNAFRVDGLWLNTKAMSMDAHIWHGVTLRSFPPRDRSAFRGTRHA